MARAGCGFGVGPRADGGPFLPENLRLISQPVESAKLPLLVRTPSQALVRWNNVPVRRVKHPRLQFDKGLRIDLLA